MKISLLPIRISSIAFSIVLLTAFAISVPLHGTAQSSPAAPATAQAAPAPTAAPQAPKSEEEQEQAFLHAPVVGSLGKMLGLDINTASRVLFFINFLIIVFAIGIPLVRILPKVIRKRSQTLKQDLQTARAATADAQARLSVVETKLAGLGEEMKQFKAQIEQESLEDEKRIKASIGEESARVVAAAEQEIGVAAAQARRSLRNFAADLAIEHAEKQLHLTPEIDRALIAEFVADIAGDNGGNR